MAMAMRREKAAAKLPEPRPDLLAIRLRDMNRVNRRAREELEPPFAARLRQRRQLLPHLEQEHEPMRLALVPVLAHHARQVQIRRRQFHAHLLLRLATGARIGRFPDVHLQLAAARAPETAVRLLGPLQQQHLVLLIKAIEQRGDFVGQRHFGNEECRMKNAETNQILLADRLCY